MEKCWAYREILSVLLCLSAAFVSALDDLMPESFPQGRHEEQQQRAVSSFCLDPFLPFLFCLLLEEGRWASQKSVHSHATAASEISSLSLLCRHLFKCSILSAACVLHWLDNQKSLWDVNEQRFTAQHTTGSLWSVCTAVQRLTRNGVSQACWEHDGGPDLPAGGPA